MDAGKQQALNHSVALRIARHFRGSVTDFGTWFGKILGGWSANKKLKIWADNFRLARNPSAIASAFDSFHGFLSAEVGTASSSASPWW
jgi:hypothetical protein